MMDYKEMAEIEEGYSQGYYEGCHDTWLDIMYMMDMPVDHEPYN